ncbi:hypothetical protein PMI36_01518 [Pseudomonas sp. GM79]|uniref:hypothetical protein n=1 Tax=Pseudomonas sp. GM79 TaxID=1144338 RepID=UPI00026F72BD|nr:hypothetical protein [Pseudomonas sp. GM79]EJN25900.1 hypothetical protein PMI36_01518 [Pseudomonas sp. GM79]
MTVCISLRDSIVNLRSLLYDVIASPEKYIDRQDIFNALVTQSSMAEFASEEFSLLGCSVNTFKTLASTTVIEGFKGLNNLRHEAYQLLEAANKEVRRKNGSRRNLNASNKKLEKSLSYRHAEIIVLVSICSELRALSQKLALSDLPDRAAYFRKEIAVVDTKLLSIGRNAK